ncbi:MAG: ATP-grasp domain-containing protein [Planctomycetota bacterium]|nr:MAG: ATP-grasp domain-containing protein [Planctomycetota bacterium]
MAGRFNLPRKGDNATLILIGASVRSLAFSCIRAGYQPWCIDLYADEDLAKNCPTTRITKSFPNEISALIKTAPLAPILYTGGLENHPALLQSLSAERTILGITGNTLTNLRNTSELYNLLKSKQINTPSIIISTKDLNKETSYLRKPKYRSGGLGIKHFDPSKQAMVDDSDFYYQEFIKGESRSAIFCFTESGFELLGVSIQSSGSPYLHANDFLYSGNMGPVNPCNSELKELQTIGELISSNYRPLGLLGMDYILNDSKVYPIELNPRYTASMEVLELALGQNFITKHMQAFGIKSIYDNPTPSETTVIGKAIYYAPHDVLIPKEAPWLSIDANPRLFSPFADIPKIGSAIQKGSPVVTIFAKADSLNEVKTQLKIRTSQLDSLFHVGTLQNNLV